MEEGVQFAADLTHFATLQSVNQKLLNTLHLSTPHDALSLEDYRYSKDDVLASGFIAWIEANRPVLQGIITIPTSSTKKRVITPFMLSTETVDNAVRWVW